jgi:tetratricopeptide (TPR) repeat protein
MLPNRFIFVALATILGFVCLSQAQNKTNVHPLILRPPHFQQRAIIDQRPAPPQDQLREARTLTDRFIPPAKTAVPWNPQSAEASIRSPGNILVPVTPKAAEASRVLLVAQQLHAKGDLTNALNSFDNAESIARRLGDQETAGVAALNYARALQTAPGFDAAQAGQRLRVVKKYQIAVADAPPAQRALARNNLSALLLQEGKYGDAVKVLRDMDWRSADPKQEYLCRFNLGRAEELNGNTAAALEQYRLALKLQPAYNPAIDGAFRILQRSTNVEQTAVLGEELIAQGETLAASRNLHACVQRFSRAEKVPLLLTALVRCYTAQRFTPPQFESAERDFLHKVAEAAPNLQQLVEGIERAFSADFKPVFSLSFTREVFRAWNETAPQKDALSRLLQNVGNYYSSPNGENVSTPPPRALACYTAAWMLDNANTDAALRAVFLLHEYRTSLDPRGEGLNELVRQLFLAKGNAYAIPIKTRQDWLNLMRLHIVLASAYERTGVWGPQDRVDSALFQLTRAVEIEDLLQRDDPAFVPSPALYARLARAYREVGQKQQAWTQYVRAAEGFAYFREPAQISGILADAAALQLALDSRQMARLESVKQNLDRISQP